MYALAFMLFVFVTQVKLAVLAALAYKENTYGVATISRMLKNIGLFAEYRSFL